MIASLFISYLLERELKASSQLQLEAFGHSCELVALNPGKLHHNSWLRGTDLFSLRCEGQLIALDQSVLESDFGSTRA
jgi:hypothetical protein